MLLLFVLVCKMAMNEQPGVDIVEPRRTASPAHAPYTALAKGDSGDDVKRLQTALIEYGYLDGEADGRFGPQTEQAVQLFNTQNFSDPDPVASREMQDLLLDGRPKRFKDLDAAMCFGEKSYAQWNYLSGDRLKIHFQHMSVGRTVEAFEIHVYAENIWGERVYGLNVYKGTTEKTVKPGKTVYTDYVTLPNRSEIDKVYCGVYRILYSDGTTYTAPIFDIPYVYWEIK